MLCLTKQRSASLTGRRPPPQDQIRCRPLPTPPGALPCLARGSTRRPALLPAPAASGGPWPVPAPEPPWFPAVEGPVSAGGEDGAGAHRPILGLDTRTPRPHNSLKQTDSCAVESSRGDQADCSFQEEPSTKSREAEGRHLMGLFLGEHVDVLPEPSEARHSPPQTDRDRAVL